MTGITKNEKPRRLNVVFDGRVQGVGFRFTTVEIARVHHVTGYVQNMMDGSVKLVVEGMESEIHALLNDIRSSHIFQFVTREDLHWRDATGEFTEFVIRYS